MLRDKENKKLLEFLREDMNITSVKNGCAEGACGTCMVIIDGKATKACVFNTQKLVGKNIVTIEGMSEKEITELTQCTYHKKIGISHDGQYSYYISYQNDAFKREL